VQSAAVADDDDDYQWVIILVKLLHLVLYSAAQFE